MTRRGGCWALCAAWLLCACQPGGKGAPAVGSDTNWLQACTDDRDCGTSVCRCGVCTLPCTDLAACAEIAAAQICIEASDLSATSCRLGFSEPASFGICSQVCDSHADCGTHGGTAAYCIEGVCLPAGAATPRGSIATLAAEASSDGAALDASSPLDPATVGSGAAGEGAGGADAGATGAIGDGQLQGALVKDSSGAVMSIVSPQPRCPCESDWPSDVAAPARGEVDSNPYGNPLPPDEPTGSQLERMAYWLDCGTTGTTEDEPWWFVAESECVRYANCNVPCEQDADCPSGGSGTASPRCATTGYCFLDCRAERACPEGMACVTGTDGAACYWPQDVLSPACPAHCRQRPPPRECENWCADLLVACDSVAGVFCCEGLVCTSGGYCDVPG